MYVKTNLSRPSVPNAGGASQKNEIVLVETEDLLVFPKSNGSGVLLVGNPVLKEGGKFIKIYSTLSKTDAPFETEGDEDQMSFAHKFIAQYPGNGLEVKEFVQNWTGKNIVIFHKACGEEHYEVMGSPCAPLQLKTAKQDNNDGRSYTLTFESFAKSKFVPKQYNGQLPFAEPFAVADLSLIDITLANGNQYKLPSTSGAIAINTMNLEHGSLVSLIGGGGATSATLANGVSGPVTVLLKDATPWSAEANAVIHFKVFDANATVYLIEESRD